MAKSDEQTRIDEFLDYVKGSSPAAINGVDAQSLSQALNFNFDGIDLKTCYDEVFKLMFLGTVIQLCPHPLIVKKLVKEGVDVNDKIKKSGRTALMHAVIMYYRASEQYSKAREDFNSTDKMIERMQREMKGQEDVIKTLIELGADVTIKGGHGSTALDLALKGHILLSLPLLEMLVEANPAEGVETIQRFVDKKIGIKEELAALETIIRTFQDGARVERKIEQDAAVLDKEESALSFKHSDRTDLNRFKGIVAELSLANRVETDELIADYKNAQDALDKYKKNLAENPTLGIDKPGAKARELYRKAINSDIERELARLDKNGLALRDTLQRLDVLSKSVEPRSYSVSEFRKSLKNAWASLHEFVTITGDKSLKREMDKISEILLKKDEDLSQAKAKFLVHRIINALVPKLLRSALHAVEDALVRWKAASHGVEGYGEKGVEKLMKGIGKKLGRHNKP